MHTYIAPLDLVRERPPERPVALVRPDVVAVAARWFQEHIEGETLYAVKANPSPWMIRALTDAGIEAFDVASVPEMEAVRAVARKARLAFMNPVKSIAAIATAYFDHGVTVFAVDCQAELEKIRRALGPAPDLSLIVRLAVDAPGAAYPLSGRFGVEPRDAPELLLAARQASGGPMGIAFHVGSQCLEPNAYEIAMAQASAALSRAGVLADVVDVGGGFPAWYPGLEPPPLAAYARAVRRGFEAMNVPESAALWCEPGRALAAEAASLLVRIELRRDNVLHLNDGAYGALYDAAHSRWNYPAALVREGGSAAPLTAFRFFGPTCDAADVIEGPFWLPADVREGDYIELSVMGAYGVALASRFNGFGDIDTVRVRTPPAASMYGLAPLPQAPAAAVRQRPSRRRPL
ncbi:MAG TPA: type III PLP-dependent enzyme [Caulobacteraceae bacterium]|nr:type III PLP-dependent enzyme [Caulobacteraceae bacterium]